MIVKYSDEKALTKLELYTRDFQKLCECLIKNRNQKAICSDYVGL